MHVIWNILTMKICLYAFFPRFQLPIDEPSFSIYRFCRHFFKLLWLNLIPNLFILSLSCFFLRDIEWHCIGRVFIVLWHAITKYIFTRLDKQWYQCLVNLIAYNITTVFSIFALYLIRYHHLVHINRKYISYLSLSIKVFSCNLFLTKFQHLHLLIHF